MRFKTLKDETWVLLSDYAEIENKLKDAESALVWYACHCPVGSKEKYSKDGGASSMVADRYFKKNGYNEKKVRAI